MNQYNTQEEYDKLFKIQKPLEPHEGTEPQDYKWRIIDAKTNQKRTQFLGVSSHKDRWGIFWAITDVETGERCHFANRYSSKREAQTELDRFAKENRLHKLADIMSEHDIL